jgi:hypothetical protein
MVVPDVDYNMNFQGYSPRVQYGNLPTNNEATHPFYFGGSNVRSYREVEHKISHSVIKHPKMKVVKRL